MRPQDDTAVVESFASFVEIDAVLDIARYPILKATDPYLFSRQRAIRGMEVFANRYEERFNHLNPHRDIKDYFHIQISAERSGQMEGREISFQELWGHGYDLIFDKVQLFTYSDSCRYTDVMDGLAYALLDPPYGLRRPEFLKTFNREYGESEQKWMRELVHQFCSEVLEVEDRLDTKHLTILDWPTDWSNYFDAGKEFWGAFYWTVLDPRKDWITVLAASSTD